MARDMSEVFGPEELPAPQSPIRTVYTDSGEEVVEYIGAEFGNQPEWSKKELIGQGLVFRGLSDDTFHPEDSTFPPARSVLYNLVTEEATEEPWGMFYSDLGDQDRRTSVLIKQVRKEFRRNGNRPFIATLEYVNSEVHKGQGYYKLARYIRNVNPSSE